MTVDRPIFGRQRDETLVEERLRTAPLVTLLGPPGIGKTRLAETVVASARERGAFPGGAFACYLADVTTLDDVALAVGDALGCGAQNAADVGVALAARDATLLLLDNFEQLVPLAAATVGRWLEEAGARLRVLVTSRVPLGLAGEARVELAPLDERAGVELLCALACAIRADWADPQRDRALLAEIVGRLDGIPLAIELAAARASLLSPRALLERLASRLEILGPAAAATSGRQATLRAAIDWSWSLLDPIQREVLVRCAYFSGGFTLAAAEVVAAPGAADGGVLDALQALREHSLLRPAPAEEGEPRLDMLESVHEYAREKLDASGWRPAVADRHARHYLAQGEEWVRAVRREESPRSLDRLARDAGNLRVAHAWLEGKDPVMATRMALVLDAFLSVRGQVAQRMAVLDGALGLPGDPDPARRARLLSARGDAWLVRRKLSEAERDFSEAVTLARASGERALEAVALRGLGIAFREAARPDDALALFGEALAIAREIDDRHLDGVLHSNVGTLRRYQGQPERALPEYERALALFAEGGYQRSEAIVRGNLGHVYVAMERLDDADQEYRAALASLREIGDRRSEAILSGSLAGLLVDRGHASDAAHLYARALDLSRELGDEAMTALYRAWLAALVAIDDRLAEAEQSFARARLILERGGHASWGAAVSVLEGVLEIARSRRAAAAGDDALAATALADARARLGGGAGVAASAEHVATASRWLTRLLDPSAGPPASPARIAADAPALEVGPEARWFRMADGERVDLTRRRPLRRVLRLLTERRRTAPGQAVPALAIAQAVWPKEQLEPRVATSRIYVVVAELRKLGLRDAVARHEDGYLLHPAVPLSEPAGS